MLKGSRLETMDSDSIPSEIKDSRKKANSDQNGVYKKIYYSVVLLILQRL